MARPTQKEFEIALKVEQYFDQFGYRISGWHGDRVEIQIPHEGRYWVPVKDIYKTIVNYEDRNKLPFDEGVKKIKEVIREEVKNALSEQKWDAEWKKAKLTDDEIILVNSTFEHYAKSGPIPQRPGDYVYINPRYAVKILKSALSGNSLTDKGKNVAKSILSKLEKAGTKET